MNPASPSDGRPPRPNPAIPIGRAIALIGGLAIVAAYAMPWFGVAMSGQGIVLSGQFLGRFLAGTDDLRRFMPGATGGAAEVQMLRGLVYVFPASGLLAAVVAAATAWSRFRRPSDVALVLLGLVPLAALAIGLSRLPPGSSIEIGVWTIGGGTIAVIVGAALDWSLGRS
jgi:hypothetical protein